MGNFIDTQKGLFWTVLVYAAIMLPIEPATPGLRPAGRGEGEGRHELRTTELEAAARLRAETDRGRPHAIHPRHAHRLRAEDRRQRQGGVAQPDHPGDDGQPAGRERQRRAAPVVPQRGTRRVRSPRLGDGGSRRRGRPAGVSRWAGGAAAGRPRCAASVPRVRSFRRWLRAAHRPRRLRQGEGAAGDAGAEPLSLTALPRPEGLRGAHVLLVVRPLGEPRARPPRPHARALRRDVQGRGAVEAPRLEPAGARRPHPPPR